MMQTQLIAAPMDEIEREPSAYRYHLLRAATERFQCNIPSLTDQQRPEATRLAQRTFELEERVLGSDEARDVLIPDAQLQRFYAEVEKRYQDEAELEADLERNGLTTHALRRALHRELIFDAVLQRVAADHAPITEADERLFYELHRGRFCAPERRSARHILITINDDYAENTRDAARARIESIAERLAERDGDRETRAHRFGRLAKRSSECPTAMEGGSLGAVHRGQLYPALDAALFGLPEGGISAIVETEMGFHLIFCETIHPGNALPFNKVRDRIREALEQRRRKERQRNWLAALAEREQGKSATR